MFWEFVKRIVGSRNERELKRIQPLADQINQWEKDIQKLSDYQLQQKTGEFKERFEKGEGLEALLCEAFAVVREASRRVLDMRHFDVQLLGGIVLHEGKIAEMATGEGKTLVATLPVYLNALTGRGVHVVTVNDYLAKRDSEWMGVIYKFLGLTVGVIQHQMDDRQRQGAYLADVTYGTNNEFGFDYLRDNMKFSLEHYVQRELNYAIVDEVDSILIDEARTPLIISGLAEESTEKYYQIDRIIPRLKREEDYQIDEKARTVSLSEEGVGKAERLLAVENLYDPSNMEILHHVQQALKSHTLFKRDVDYVVKNGEVIIVDEFTGRLMPGRRYSDGLHQALEAKEKVHIANENQTLATITFQNYFRLYNKLAGMTGTAETEAAEFHQIYGLDVIVIPTNRFLIRYNYSDVIYRTEKEKFNAVVKEIEELHRLGRPILVGTISIEKSELLSRMLKRRGIKHQVLNAKHHEREAEIVAQAGRLEAVTIATNMAGRGTDILLGGNPEFLALAEADPQKDPDKYQQTLPKYRGICAREHEEVIRPKQLIYNSDDTAIEGEIPGGLHIIATERHEARRIDNQLRGRAGRQGDPGSSRFYLSLEDDLLRIFGSERLSGLMQRLGMEDGQPIEHKWVTRAIENAQRKVEAHNFDIRKHLLEYDDVMNKQREVIYQQRRQCLEGRGLKEIVFAMLEEVLDDILVVYVNSEMHPEEWDLEGLRETMWNKLALRLNLDRAKDTISLDGRKDGPLPIGQLKRDSLREALLNALQRTYENKEKRYGEAMIRHLEKMIMLQIIDTQWKDHLLNMDYLKEGIGLRGYGQRDPLNEYKKEGYEMFMAMVQRIKEEATEYLFKAELQQEAPLEHRRAARQRIIEHRGEFATASAGAGGGDGQAPQPVRRVGPKVGRNEPCPCGSGKKYKKCCAA
ncbi:MAG: preprotein translocase subunit SecA [Nitrospinae bacterium RIFCSPLOWO2_12_FULL_45_22]|nr:MAG: preprotein translocase subunit SecA [Nitrospinae bacterium RIFCSPLOWO2_12_FULL_45_22]